MMEQGRRSDAERRIRCGLAHAGRVMEYSSKKKRAEPHALAFKFSSASHAAGHNAGGASSETNAWLAGLSG